jgi:hypothetical protein
VGRLVGAKSQLFARYIAGSGKRIVSTVKLASTNLNDLNSGGRIKFVTIVGHNAMHHMLRVRLPECLVWVRLSCG